MTDLDWLSQFVADDEDRKALLRRAYKQGTAADRRQVTLAKYRCKARGCELLTCWQTPLGRLVYQPHFKLSPARNEATSVPAARAKRTTDGNRRWVSVIVDLDQLLGFANADMTVGLEIKCDHIIPRLVPVVDLVTEVEQATPGHPRRIII